MATSNETGADKVQQAGLDGDARMSAASGVPSPKPDGAMPAAGAHAAGHLTNEDATPGSGALTSRAHASGKEVDGGAG